MDTFETKIRFATKINKNQGSSFQNEDNVNTKSSLVETNIETNTITKNNFKNA